MSFLQQMEADLTAAKRALDSSKFDDGLAITSRYVGPASRSRDFLLMHALLLQRNNSFREADGYYQRALELDPNQVQAIVQRAHGLRYLGRNAEALAFVVENLQRHSGNGGLFATYLNLTLTVNGLLAAMAALAAGHQALPKRELEIAIELFRQKALALHDPEEVRQLDTQNLLELEGISSPGGYNMRQIYEMFEPLGHNCEFGFMQRQHGAEPLSLLRWTGVSPESLIKLLSADLADYDNPVHYSLRGNAVKEYHLYEDLYNTEGHTGVNASDIDPDEFLNRLTRRQGFLTRKLLADLAAGNKVFLYKAPWDISEEHMDAVETELHRLGARHCMFIMTKHEPELHGTIEFPSPTRAVGYVSPKLLTEKSNEYDKIVVKAFDYFIRPEMASA